MCVRVMVRVVCVCGSLKLQLTQLLLSHKGLQLSACGFLWQRPRGSKRQRPQCAIGIAAASPRCIQRQVRSRRTRTERRAGPCVIVEWQRKARWDQRRRQIGRGRARMRPGAFLRGDWQRSLLLKEMYE